MADIILSSFVDKLGSLLLNEAVHLRGVKDELVLLRRHLEWMKSFLTQAQHKRGESQAMVETWVTQIIDLAYDAEDVVDAYILHQERNIIKKIMHFGTLHQLGSQIQQINTRARSIADYRSMYDIGTSMPTQESVSEDMAYRRRGIHTLDESSIVGFKVERDQVSGQLKDGFPSRRVISILGMGGLGKTTLAHALFKDVSQHFEAQVWITVSEKYDARDLLLSALKHLIQKDRWEKTDWSKVDYKQIEEEIYQHFEGKRYLVVIDDIWKVEAWERINVAFPRNDKGSRIILTTRNKEVAMHAATSKEHHLELRLLDKDERWELFCRKVFSESGGVCPQDLTQVGKEIVEKCGGLPLAIIVVGGLVMGRERTVSAWSKVRDSAKWQLSQDSNLCRETLMLSYNDLPHYLKACFLYLGLFPEDYEISAERLILLWVSEGFIQARGEEIMEDVAEDYLEELIQRSMIQVIERKYVEGPVLFCRIHDLLRDLAVSKSRKDKFMDFHSSNSVSSRGKFRRFAIHSARSEEDADQCYRTITTTNPNLRSLFLFQGKKLKPQLIPCQGTIMLRVLDMRCVNSEEALPKEIGNLFFLQYLRLDNKQLKSLPNSIGKLVNLQTLDLRKTSLLSLPKTIWKLKNLRHLFLPTCCTITQHVARLCRLSDFGRNLLTLRLGSGWSEISDVLVKAGCLRSMFMANATSFGNGLPLSLIHLPLACNVLGEEKFAVLGSLPKLKSLSLVGADRMIRLEKMVFTREGFSQLEFLKIGGAEIIEWRVEDGALPSLRELGMIDCRGLQKLPDGLRNVTSLQRITIGNMPRTFTNRVKENGEDWDIIKHVPTIHISREKKVCPTHIRVFKEIR